MGSSQSAEEWNRNCGTVKRAYGGYPEWWYPEVVLSGLADRTAANWGGDAPDLCVADFWRAAVTFSEMGAAMAEFHVECSRNTVAHHTSWTLTSRDLHEAIDDAESWVDGGYASEAVVTSGSFPNLYLCYDRDGWE